MVFKCPRAKAADAQSSPSFHWVSQTPTPWASVSSSVDCQIGPEPQRGRAGAVLDASHRILDCFTCIVQCFPAVLECPVECDLQIKWMSLPRKCDHSGKRSTSQEERQGGTFPMRSWRGQQGKAEARIANHS